MKVNNNPLITVVTVCYNCKDEIEITIRSVLGQSCRDYEYIIIDGSSSDGTLGVLTKYEDKVSTVISEPDNGIYDAMNKGLRMAHGQWVIFMNSGDYFYSRDSLDNVVQYLTDDRYFVYGDTEYRRKSGTRVEKALPIEYIEKNMPTCHQSFLVKTEKAREIGFQTKYKYAADYNMMYKLYKKYGSQHFCHIPVVISSYNAIEGTTLSHISEVYLEVQKIRNWSFNKVMCYINYFFKRIADFLK